MKFKSTVTSTNTLPALIKKLKILEDYEAAAGFDSRPHPEGGTPLHEVAANNEFGIDVLERPFMSRTFFDISTRKKSLTRVIEGVVYKGTKPKAELKNLAELLQQLTRDAITEGHYPVTTNDTPLINTGFMLNSILAEVVKKET